MLNEQKRKIKVNINKAKKVGLGAGLASLKKAKLDKSNF